MFGVMYSYLLLLLLLVIRLPRHQYFLSHHSDLVLVRLDVVWNGTI